MKDRVATKPNRYAVYDDSHNFIRYEYHERADEPTEAGDGLNTANLLPSDVAASLGLTGNPQVKDALNKIATLLNSHTNDIAARLQIQTGSYTGTGTFGSANKKTLVFSRTPKFVIIYSATTKTNLTAVWLYGTQYGISAPNQFYAAELTWNENTLSWFQGDAQSQLNVSGVVYYYAAISL